jgi:hypothetical protein
MKTKHLTAAILALSLGTAQAAPFAITYTGTIGNNSTVPGFPDGTNFYLTLVVDNGSATVTNGLWEPQHLRCAIWRLPNLSGDAIIAHDLVASPPGPTTGQVQTDVNGDLSTVFTIASASAIAIAPPTAVRASGLPLGLHLDGWWVGSGNNVFRLEDAQGTGYSFGDASGGISNDYPDWSNPEPFAGNCLDAAGPALPPGAGGGNVASVPTLGHAALALLGALVGGLGLRAKRREES